MQAIVIRKFSDSQGSLQKIPGTKFWKVTEPFIWYIDYYDHSKGSIIVPAGFITDLGSIPSPLRILFDQSKWMAFILHDFIYSQKYIEIGNQRRILSRKECDVIMLEALYVEGCKNPERALLYFGVRLLGWTRF